jgi:hypothetical protein
MAAAAETTHRCNWPGCEKNVPRSLWGCAPHWAKLPRRIRDNITKKWNHGRGFGTTDYGAACQEAQNWIRQNKERT